MTDDLDDVFDVWPPEGPTLADLADLPNWVAWREEKRNGKATKIPYAATRSGKARADDPETWGMRTQAERRTKTLLRGGRKGGIGLELGPLPDGRHIGGIDLDSCRVPETGEFTPWATKIIELLDTYAEVSPSTTGAKAFFEYDAEDLAKLRAAMGTEHTRKFDQGKGIHPPGMEFCVSGKFFTVTGDRLPDSPEELRKIPLEELLHIIRVMGPEIAGQKTRRGTGDNSRSGRAMSLVGKFKCQGRSKEEWLDELSDDPELGEWAEDARQTDRAWQRFDCLDADIDMLNERHALVVVEGKALVATQHNDGRIELGTVRDMHALYDNHRVPVSEKQTEPISRRWMRHPNRRTYTDGMEFSPGRDTPGKLNLWRGFAVEPDPIQSCERFLQHIREVVCDGDEEQYDFLIGWLAHMVKRPDEKPGVGIVLRGLKGTGKDSVADYVALMIGRRHAPTVAQSEHIVGRFNRRLEAALLLHVQEGSWAGDRKAEAVLKYIVTSETVEIERKGVDSFSLRSVLRVFISANANWVVPASPDERRWAVFEVSDCRKGDKSYWDAFHAEKDGDGPAALLHYLQRYDISDFDVRKVPNTKGLRNQKLASLRGIYAWWFDVLESGELGSYFQEADWQDRPLAIPRDELRGLYHTYAKNRRFEGDPIDSRQFGIEMRKLLPGIDNKRSRTKRGRSWQYILPPLPSARRQFDQWLASPVDWEAEP